MKRKYRIIKIIMVLSLITGLATGCTKNTDKQTNTDENAKLSVLCTTYPQYDWAKQVIGDRIDNFELTLLMKNGTDLHNYQPTAEDIAKISDCDVLIYVGGSSDVWIENALKDTTNSNKQIVNLMDALGENIKEEEHVDGMQHDEHDHNEHDGEDHDEDHDHDQEHGEDNYEDDHSQNEIEYDEHIWLSLNNAQAFVHKIQQAITNADSAYANVYEKNSNDYIEKLNSLDDEFKQTVSSAKRDTVLFGDRFPFRYLVDDYNIKYFAAFAGCSAETEASFETVAFLSEKIDELQLPYVLTIENSNDKIAKAIINNTQNKNQEIIVMNSLQSITASDIKNGFSYINAMQENLEALKKALN